MLEFFWCRWYWNVLWHEVLQWSFDGSGTFRECSVRGFASERSKDVYFQARLGFSEESLLQWRWMYVTSTRFIPFSTKLCTRKLGFSLDAITHDSCSCVHLHLVIWSDPCWFKKQNQKMFFFCKRMWLEMCNGCVLLLIEIQSCFCFCLLLKCESEKRWLRTKGYHSQITFLRTKGYNSQITFLIGPR